MYDWFRWSSILALAVWGSTLHAQHRSPTLPAFVADQVIVSFHPGTPGNEVASAHRQAGAAELRRNATLGTIVVNVAAGSVPAAVAAYSRNPNVRFAEPNYLRPMIIPNEGSDPPPPTGLGIDYFSEQYGLHNTGQAFYYDQLTGQPGAIAGYPDADIDAPEAWDIATGSIDIKVAILDSGIDCLHPDLVDQCGENLNFSPSSSADDVIGHGTHVAGIAGATGNNNDGIAGVSWNTTIANLKVCHELYDPFFGVQGVCDSASIADGITHAANNGYHVINMSFAGPDLSQTEASAATYAWNQGVVLVAAAGNNYSQTPMYPANFPEVIAVAATDWFDNVAAFSNFGSWVSLAAPGYYTFSTMPNAACGLAPGDPEGCYAWQSGTSMASPTVAGAAAVIWSHLGNGATNTQVRDALEANADTAGAMNQNMLAWTQNGRLNLHSSLSNGGGQPPPGDPGVHVGDLDGAAMNQGKNWMAEVTVYVHDETEVPADGYTVSGTWSGGFSGADSCAVVSGSCTLTSGAMPKRNSNSATFRITSVSGSGAYQSIANHDPDGDSDGQAITVTR